jgi:hypothetical protein
MVDDGCVLELAEKVVVIRLTVHQYILVVRRHMILFKLYERDTQKVDHGQVVEPPYGADHADCGGTNFVPEKSFDGKSGADGIGIGIYDDEKAISGIELCEEPLQDFVSGIPFVGGVVGKVPIISHRLRLGGESEKTFKRKKGGFAHPESSCLERETGFEPATSTLARLHSTAELFPLSCERKIDKNGVKVKRKNERNAQSPIMYIM